MKNTKNILLKGSAEMPVATDIFYDENGIGRRPVIVYAHGFNGFKDWGTFDLIAARFAGAGFTFVKFNFSHNGTTPQALEEFNNLNAYAENNYTRELYDLEVVLDWISDPENPFAAAIDAGQLFLLGHSMGGGISLLKAAEDTRVKAICTWAAIAECKTPWNSWTPEKMQLWKDTGVIYTLNSRTKQEMPLNYQLYEDFILNKERLDIEHKVSNLKIPLLICHGTQDPAVPAEKAHLLKGWKPDAEIFLTDGDHVFGRRHPWPGKNLPAAMEAVLERTIRFFRKCSLT